MRENMENIVFYCSANGSAEDIFEAERNYITFDKNVSSLEKITKQIFPFAVRSDYDKNERLDYQAQYARSPKKLLKILKQQGIMSTDILYRVLKNPNVDNEVLVEAANLFTDEKVFKMLLRIERPDNDTFRTYIPDSLAELSMTVLQRFITHSSQTPELIQSFYKQLPNQISKESDKYSIIIGYIATAEKTSTELVEKLYKETNDAKEKVRILLYGNVTESFFEQEIKEVFSYHSFDTLLIFDGWINREGINFKKVEILIANQRDIYEDYVHSIDESIEKSENTSKAV